MDRNTFAIAALSLAAVLQVVILARGEESPGWAIASIALLAGACVALIRSRQH